MVRPRHDFGVDIASFDLNTLLRTSWEAEKDRSSMIQVLPTSGLIKKEKRRRLDFTVYEVFSTLFFSSLLEKYTQLFGSQGDLTLYSPQTIKIQYGQEGDNDSLSSTIYELFCPGTPLNRIEHRKKKDLKVENESVNVADKVMYLSGVMYEVFLREGIVHGDPQLRHFILLPKMNPVYHLDENGLLQGRESNSGIATIDVEHARVFGDYSSESDLEGKRFKYRIFERFLKPSERGEEYFDRGVDFVRNVCDSSKTFSPEIMIFTKDCFDRFFPGSKVKEVNLEKGTVNWY
jgi:hypothetical protein